MKPRNYTDYLIAFVVLSCSAALLAALTMALSGFRWTGTGKTVQIDFPTVTGIHVNSQLRYAGKPVGVITRIDCLDFKERSLAADPNNAIRVTALVYADAPALYRQTKAVIASDTLLSEKFVDLLPLDMSGDQARALQASPPQLLAQGDTLQGEATVSLDMLTQSGYQTIKDLNAWIVALKTQCPDLPQKFTALLDQGHQLTQHADILAVHLDNIIQENNPQLQHVMNDLQVVSQNLKVTSTYAKTLSGTLAQKPWKLVWGGKPHEIPSEEEILKSSKPVRCKISEPSAPAVLLPARR